MQENISLLILIIGAVMSLAVLIEAGMNRLRLPAMIGFLALGILLRVIQSQADLLPESGEEIFDFLAKLGIFCLLFRVGLESDLPGLIHKLKPASLIWIGTVVVSAAAGFFAAGLLGFDLIPRLFVATAMTATSVGIPVSIWQQADRLKTEPGELFVDVAELDDLSGVVLMAVLFAVAGSLRTQADSAVQLPIVKAMGFVLLKLAGFALVCVIFSRYLERPITRFLKYVHPALERTILLVGLALVIAALAGWLGFSLAIGAFFAGLVFSRDPEAVKIETSFETIYRLFVPFFFIGIGLSIDPSGLSSGLYPGLVLLLAAVAGKFLGTAIPTAPLAGKTAALLISISMIPRAEITLVIMQRGRELGDWAVTGKLFSAMVLVCAATCAMAPLVLLPLLKQRLPEIT